MPKILTLTELRFEVNFLVCEYVIFKKHGINNKRFASYLCIVQKL